jgi:AcrR family transcriptional regulator
MAQKKSLRSDRRGASGSRAMKQRSSIGITQTDSDEEVHTSAGVSSGGSRKGTSYRRGIETRDRLITATQEAVAEIGFNRTSSREVARRAGLTFGVIQHHFGTYEALLLATVATEGDRLREVLAGAEITGDTPEQCLAALADLIWEFVSRPENLAFMDIHNNLMRDPSTSAEALELLQNGRELVEAQWLDLMARSFDWHEPDPSLRYLLFATLRGLAITRWMSQDTLTMDRERALFVEAMAPYFERAGQR